MGAPVHRAVVEALPHEVVAEQLLVGQAAVVRNNLVALVVVEHAVVVVEGQLEVALEVVEPNNWVDLEVQAEPLGALDHSH